MTSHVGTYGRPRKYALTEGIYHNKKTSTKVGSFRKPVSKEMQDIKDAQKRVGKQIPAKVKDIPTLEKWISQNKIE